LGTSSNIHIEDIPKKELDGKKGKIHTKRDLCMVLTFAILGYHGAVKTTTGNLDWPLSEERFHKSRRVAVAFGSVSQPSKFALHAKREGLEENQERLKEMLFHSTR
jgi:hypothetical protein